MIKREEELEKIPDLHYKALNYVFENNMVPENGMWLEFGVYSGGSINRIARCSKGKIVYGFDSFEGLPEAWAGRVESWGGTYGPGTFSLGGVLPKVSQNVQLIKGWFKDSLPIFLKEHPDPVSFIHVDSDIYSSARDILNCLKNRICNGCIIVFDEMVGYPSFENHEWKAWWEFVEGNSIVFEWIGGNRSKAIKLREDVLLFERGRPPTENVSPSHENVAVKILTNPVFKI